MGPRGSTQRNEKCLELVELDTCIPKPPHSYKQPCQLLSLYLEREKTTSETKTLTEPEGKKGDLEELDQVCSFGLILNIRAFQAAVKIKVWLRQK
jgi:hypothetical protein